MHSPPVLRLAVWTRASSPRPSRAVGRHSPLGIACILWCVAALARFFKPRWSVPLLWASVGVLSVFSSKWVGNGLLGQLERQYSIVSVETVPQADVIVVLGGTTVPALAPRVEVEVTEAFDRLLHGMRLYRAGKAPHILLSGGTIPELSGSTCNRVKKPFPKPSQATRTERKHVK